MKNILTALICFFLLGCALNDPMVHMANEDLCLDFKTMENNRNAFRSGNMPIADMWKMFEHHGGCFYDQPAAFGWLTEIAHRGDPKAMALLGRLTIKSDFDFERRVAIVWLNKAASLGSEDAKKALIVIKEHGTLP